LVVYACARRDLVLVAVPDPRGPGIPYSAAKPFVATLLGTGPAPSADDLDVAASRHGLVGDAVAGLREIFLPEGAEGLGGPTRVRVAGLAVRTLVARQATRRRILAVVEQIQRCDPLSRRVFARLAEPPLPPGVFLVGLHTPRFEAAWPSAQRIEIAGREGADSALEVVAARLQMLDRAVLQVLRAAAVLGLSTREDLEALCPSVPIADALGILAERGYLSDAPDGVSFAHWIVADQVLAEMPAEERSAMRLSAAEHTRQLRGPAQLAAEHALECEVGFLPLLLLDRGGDEALRRGDHESAARYFTRGLEMAREASLREDDRSFDPTYATMLFSRNLGRALLAAGDRVRARRVLSSALELADADSPPRRDIHALLAEAGEIVVDGPSRATPTAVARIRTASPPKGMPA
jgi:hypothetical protein